MISWTRLSAVMICLATVLTSCFNARDVDPAARPGKDELDSMQQSINSRPDLENVEAELVQIQEAVRAVIGRVAPQAQLSATPAADGKIPPPGEPRVCDQPYDFNIGRMVRSGDFDGGPVTDEQWQAIAVEVEPLLTDAGFTAEPAPTTATPGYRVISMRRDDVLVDLFGRAGDPEHLRFRYRIGCRMPSAWRTSTPPDDLGLGLGPGSHYPYLFSDGRTDRPT